MFVLIKSYKQNIMKNILSKISVLVVAVAIFIGGTSLVNAQQVIIDKPIPANTSLSEDFNWGMWGMGNMYGNRFNQDFQRFDQNIDRLDWQKNLLENKFPAFAGAFVGLSLIFALLVISLLAFWVWMMVHAIKHDIDYKPVWILVLWFANIFGAVIYYFAVKRCCPCCQDLEEVCICENGTCVCGKTRPENIKDFEDSDHDHDHDSHEH